MQSIRRTYLVFEGGSLASAGSGLTYAELEAKVKEYLDIHAYRLAFNLVNEARTMELKKGGPSSKLLESYDDMDIRIRHTALREAGKAIDSGHKLIAVRYLEEGGYSTLAKAYAGVIVQPTGDLGDRGATEKLGLQLIPPARSARDDRKIEALVRKITAEESRNARRSSVDGATAEAIARRIALQEVKKHERMVADEVKKVLSEMQEEEKKKQSS